MQVKIAIIQLSIIAAWLGLSTTLQAQQDPLAQGHILDLINAQNVLSILVVMIVLGAGRWFNNKGWPWLSEYMENKQRYERELSREQAAITREAFQIINNVSFAIGEITTSLNEFRARLSQHENRMATRRQADE